MQSNNIPTDCITIVVVEEWKVLNRGDISVFFFNMRHILRHILNIP
jgi:hypothetical protein